MRSGPKVLLIVYVHHNFWDAIYRLLLEHQKAVELFCLFPAKILGQLLVFLEGKLTSTNHSNACQVFICFRGIINTEGDIINTSQLYHQFCGECSALRTDIIILGRLLSIVFSPPVYQAPSTLVIMPGGRGGGVKCSLNIKVVGMLAGNFHDTP